MHPETVLLVHNRYRERGGEEAVYEAECAVLERMGHRVLRYERDNADASAGDAVRAVFNRGEADAIRELVRREHVAVAHFHNFFPLISPAGHYGARAGGAAVVQTLHNFRIVCAGGLLLRDGQPCEECLGAALPFAAIRHRCYRGSAAASSVVVGMQLTHRIAGTWQKQVDAYVALSEFSRQKFIEGGLPAERIHVARGGVEDVGAGGERGAHFLFVGRLTPEKGVDVLLRAWAGVDAELRIVGEGPLRGQGPQWLGAQPRERVLEEMRRAAALVFPSVCYENFPRVIAEAMSAGLPVIASRTGGVAEVVTHGENGLLFEPGDAAGLAAAVRRVAVEDGLRERLGRGARATWAARYTPEHGYQRTMQVYEGALRRRRATA